MSDGVGALQRGVHRGIIGRQAAKVDLFAIMFANQSKRIFQHCHHSQSQQIDFHDAHVRAIFFVPLHHNAPRHRGGLQRHNGIELSLANHHAAGMLPQMSRQILNFLTQFKEFLDAMLLQIETRVLKLSRPACLLNRCTPTRPPDSPADSGFPDQTTELCRFPAPRNGRDR